MNQLLTIDNNKQTANFLIDILAVGREKTVVFDLDGVLLNAGHRIKLNKDGSMDLDQYRVDSTRDNVLKDKNLPLIELVTALNDLGVDYHVATARVLCAASQELLRQRNINPVKTLSRDGEPDRRKDWRLKADKLIESFSPDQLAGMVLIDDCLQNCNMALSLGMMALHVKTSY